ncbi:MAG: InlB B-repeat-containing protein [Kiritimatiellia bacterium]
MDSRFFVCILSALAVVQAAFAADTCTVRVTTSHSRGDGLRLLADAETPNLYVATAPTNESFTATVLADKCYTLYKESQPGEAESVVPEGVSLDTISGSLAIPAAVLAANAEKGIDITVVAKPIVYTIRYHAHGDGEPELASGASLLVPNDDDRSWVQSVDTADGEGKVVLADGGTLHAEGWVFLGWSRIQGQTHPDFEPGASVDHLVIKHLAQARLYAVWRTDPEEGKVSYPVVLQNGGFESPLIATNYYWHLAGAVITESEIQDPNTVGWSTTAADNLIEIGRLTGGAAAQYNMTAVREGQQFAELNANTAGLLYQRIATLPHTTLYWGFSHRARGSNGITGETMSMWIGSSDQIEQARAIYDKFANTKEDDENHLSPEEAMAQIDELAERLQFTNVVHTATVNTADKGAWEDIHGVFVVPSERPVTEYAFASWVTGNNGAASSYGNLLDRVYLSDSIPVERHDLSITAGPGAMVYVNDSAELTTVEDNGSFLSSYDNGTLILLTLAMRPAYHFSGIMTNGVFVARQNCDTVFLDLMRNGLREDLSIDFVTSTDAQVVFRPNGGTYVGEDGAEITSMQLSYKHPSYTVLAPTRSGYTFLGWRDLSGDLHATGSTVTFEIDEQDGSAYLVVYDPDGETERHRVSAGSGLTLYAQWEIDENADTGRQKFDVTLIATDITGDGAILKPVEGTSGTYQGKALENDDFITTIFAAEGFRLPSTIEVRNEAGELLEGWTYNAMTGVIVVPGDQVVGNLVIRASGERIRYTIVYSSGGTGAIEGDGVEEVSGKSNVWQQQVVATGDTVTLAGQGTLVAEGWTFLGWSRDATATEAEFAAGSSVPHLTRMDLSIVTLYGIWDGSGTPSFPVSLHNGSFEFPRNTEQSNPKFYANYAGGTEGLNWYTTASDNKIEIASVGTDAFQGSCISSYHTALARDGVQFAELNANYIGALYQDVSIVPGVKLYWGFSHKAREAGDALAFLIGSPDEFEQALAIYTAKVASKPTGWQQAVLDEIAAAGLTSIQVTYHEAPYDASDLYGWTDLTGTYTVPAGQNVTKFAFLSLSKHNDASKGNLIDQVYFTTSEPIQTASLTVISTTGGLAQINDGGAELVTATLDSPYARIVGIGSRVVISPVADEGWNFLGLYTGTTFHPFGACDNLLAFEMPAEDRHVTLLFAKERTITFNLEGGSYTDDSYRLSTSAPEYTLGTPTRSGYVFKGWRELTTGNVYAAGETVEYEVEAQYDDTTVRSYLAIGSGDTRVRVGSEDGLVLTAVWELEAAAVDKKLVTFVDRDYTATTDPQPYKKLLHLLLGAGESRILRNQSGLKEIYEDTTTVRPQGHEPTGWMYEPVDGSQTVEFDYIEKIEHKNDGDSAYFSVQAVTNGVLDTFRFDGVQTMRFVARWDRFYDVVRLEDDGVTTNRTVWVPKSWLDAKGYTAIGEDNYKTEIETSGANGVPLWQSYVFGLDPTNAVSVALNRPFHRLAGDQVALALDGVKVVKYLNDIYEAQNGSTLYSSWSGRDYRTYTVRFALMGTDDRVNGPWTQVGEEQETSEFRLDSAELVYRYYRIEGRVGPVSSALLPFADSL